MERRAEYIPPPTFFKRRVSNVECSWPLWGHIPVHNAGRSPAQKSGLRYERDVHERFISELPHFVPHLPFRFISEGNIRMAIPDGIAFNPECNRVTIVEVKLRHSIDAWHQLYRFYRPIVQRAFPNAELQLLEVVKNYDPGVGVPGGHVHVWDVPSFVTFGCGEEAALAIHIWSGR